MKPEAEIDVGLYIPSLQDIVIGSGVWIGRNCTIHHQDTLRGARIGDWRAGRNPQLEDGVPLFAGAKIIGAICIGDDALVAANAAVYHDVPAHHVARGIPARCKPQRRGNAIDARACEYNGDGEA